MQDFLQSRGPFVRVKDGRFLGVAGGIARWLKIDAVWVRLVFGISAIFNPSWILAYFVLAFIVPREDKRPLEPTTWVKSKDGHTPELRRTLHDRFIWGVCGGFARYWQVDPTLVRVAMVGLLAASLIVPAIVIYVVAALATKGPEPMLIESSSEPLHEA